MLSGSSNEPPRNRIGLRPKFVLAFVLQTVVIALLIVGLEQWRVRSLFQEQLLTRAEGIARTVAVATGDAVKNGRVEQLRPVADDVKSRPWIDYADFVAAVDAIKTEVPIGPGGTITVAQ